MRSRLGTLACLAFVALALPIGCGSPRPVPHMEGPPARILMVKDAILRAALAQDKTLARTFVRRTTYVIAANGSQPAVPRLAGAVEPTATYASYAAFAADVAAGRLRRSDRAVLYDIEKWGLTPLPEQQNPQAYMVRFSMLARAHGLLPILAPARDLVLVHGAVCAKRLGETLSQAYLRCGLAGADARAGALVVQSQVNQFDVPMFREFLALAARQARAGNSGVAVLAQHATAPLGRPASLAQLVAAAQSVDGFVQGFSLNVRMSDISTADSLLRSFRRP